MIVLTRGKQADFWANEIASAEYVLELFSWGVNEIR